MQERYKEWPLKTSPISQFDEMNQIKSSSRNITFRLLKKTSILNSVKHLRNIQSIGQSFTVLIENLTNSLNNNRSAMDRENRTDTACKR